MRVLQLFVGVLLILSLTSTGLVGFHAFQPAYAAGCPVNATSGDGDTFDVVVTAADGLCPVTYSASGLTHYLLETTSSHNPYTVVLSDCSGSNCPPSEIVLLGWGGNEVFCGGTQPACSSAGPWTITVDASVQAGQPCNTAPVKIDGSSGQPVLILEAGTGGDCSLDKDTPPSSGVPQFSLGSAAFGSTILAGFAGMMLLKWKRLKV